MSTRVAWVLLAGVVGVAGVHRPARAELCFPSAVGPTGGPEDARWQSAARWTHLRHEATFQALVDDSGGSRYLHLMWSVKMDPTASDVLYFGFYQGATPASAQGNVFMVTRKANAEIQDAGTPDGGSGSNATTTSVNGFFWNGAAATPKWDLISTSPQFPFWIADNMRLDVRCGASGCDSWDVRVRIKLVGAGQGNFMAPSAAPGAGLELAASFRFWYEIKTELGNNGQPALASPLSSLEFNPAVASADPDLLDPVNFADETPISGPRFPDVAKWFLASADAARVTCDNPTCTASKPPPGCLVSRNDGGAQDTDAKSDGGAGDAGVADATSDAPAADDGPRDAEADRGTMADAGARDAAGSNDAVAIPDAGEDAGARDAGGDAASPADAGSPGGACVPGRQISCACVGGAQGAQMCLASGNGYSACVCPDSGAVTAARGDSGCGCRSAGGDGTLDASWLGLAVFLAVRRRPGTSRRGRTTR